MHKQVQYILYKVFFFRNMSLYVYPKARTLTLIDSFGRFMTMEELKLMSLKFKTSILLVCSEDFR